MCRVSHRWTQYASGCVCVVDALTCISEPPNPEGLSGIGRCGDRLRLIFRGVLCICVCLSVGGVEDRFCLLEDERAEVGLFGDCLGVQFEQFGQFVTLGSEQGRGLADIERSVLEQHSVVNSEFATECAVGVGLVHALTGEPASERALCDEFGVDFLPLTVTEPNSVAKPLRTFASATIRRGAEHNAVTLGATYSSDRHKLGHFYEFAVDAFATVAQEYRCVCRHRVCALGAESYIELDCAVVGVICFCHNRFAKPFVPEGNSHTASVCLCMNFYA